MVQSNLLRQGLGYGAVGLLQLLVDWLCFVGLTMLGLDVVPANLAGRVVGAVLGFWLNGVLTFRDDAGGRLGWRRLRRFAISWAVMSLLSTAGVYFVDHVVGLRWAWLAKPVLDASLAGLGFVVSRYWIYR
jgi:putative flippase GtrA